MRTLALLAMCFLAAACSSKREGASPSDGARPPAKEPDLSAQIYEALRLDLEEGRQTIAEADRVVASRSYLYLVEPNGTVRRESGTSRLTYGFVAPGAISVSDDLVVAESKDGWIAYAANEPARVVGEASLGVPGQRWPLSAVEDQVVYLYGAAADGTPTVFRWSPGSVPSPYARMPGAGPTEIEPGVSTIPGNLERLAAINGSVFVLFTVPGSIFSARPAVGDEVRRTNLLSQIVSTAFYRDVALIGSRNQPSVAELMSVNVVTGEIIRVSDAIAVSAAARGVPKALVRTQDYAGGGSRWGEFTLYVGRSGVFALDGRDGTVIPIVLLPLEGSSTADKETLESVDAVADGTAFITSVVGQRRLVSVVHLVPLLPR